MSKVVCVKLQMSEVEFKWMFEVVPRDVLSCFQVLESTYASSGCVNLCFKWLGQVDAALRKRGGEASWKVLREVMSPPLYKNILHFHVNILHLPGTRNPKLDLPRNPKAVI